MRYIVQTKGDYEWFDSAVNPGPHEDVDGFKTRADAADAIRKQLELPMVNRGYRIVEKPDRVSFSDGQPVPDDSEAPVSAEGENGASEPQAISELEGPIDKL